MLVRYAKAGALVVAVFILVIEGFLVYRWYDPDQAPDAASGGAPASRATTAEDTVPEETTAARDASPDTAFVHRATEENSRGDYTYLDDPRIDNDPDAVVLAAPSGPYGRNVGVWYEPQERRWAIFNQDRAAVPVGSAFEVAVPPAEEGFVHRAELLNIVGNATYIDDPLVNGEPEAGVSVTQNWNPGGGNGVYNDHPVGVGYDEDVGSWFVYNTDNARMPDGAAFNISVSGVAQPAG